MLNIHKRYQVEENGIKTAVLLEIEIYKKIEMIIEQHGLRQLIEEDLNSDIVFDDSGGVYNKFG